MTEQERLALIDYCNSQLSWLAGCEAEDARMLEGVIDIALAALQNTPVTPTPVIAADDFRKWRQGHYKITQISPLVHTYEWHNDVTGLSGRGKTYEKYGFEAFHQCNINLDPDTPGSLVNGGAVAKFLHAIGMRLKP